MPESKLTPSRTPRRTPTSLREETRPWRLRLPRDVRDLDQDQEWFELEQAPRGRRRIRFHDYAEIFRVPGLYEELFHEHLQCRSPFRVRAMLEDVLEDLGESAGDLRLLDVGAGNGLVGEELRSLGIHSIVGVDLLEDARKAALRDRPSVYDAYFAVDLTRMPESIEQELRERRFNCMTCVAALGFGDIPVEAFLRALELVGVPGLVAFNIKESFLDGADPSGFDQVIRELVQEGVLRIESYRRYRHRLSVVGEPLHYAAIVASKRSSVAAWRSQRSEGAAVRSAASDMGIFTG